MSDFPEFESARSRHRVEHRQGVAHEIAAKAIEGPAGPKSPEEIRLKLIEIATMYLTDSVCLHPAALSAWVASAYNIVKHK